MLALMVLACAHNAQVTELEQDKFALQARFAEVRGDQRVSADLARLYHESEWDRAHGDPEGRGAREAARVMAVRGYVETRRVSSLPDHLHAAALLYQGTHPDDYALAHELALAASEAGLRPARVMVARSWDRLLVSRGQPQIYGTELRDTDDGLAMVDLSGEVSDEERAEWDIPPLAALVQGVLDANGAAGEPTLETLDALGLLVAPDDLLAPKAPPRLPRCANFEGLDALTPAAYAEAGIAVDGDHALVVDIEGDALEGHGVRVEADRTLVLRFDPPVALFQFAVVGARDTLSVVAWQGEEAIYPESALVLDAASEGWEAGGRAFTTGVPRMADRLEFTGAPGDVWGLDNLCVGP